MNYRARSDEAASVVEAIQRGSGRAGTGDEIAQPVMLLVSNGYMTGQTIGVNGGTLFW